MALAKSTFFTLCMLLGLSVLCFAEAVGDHAETLERGKALVAAGELRDAIPLLEEAQRGQPDSQPVRDLLIQSYKLIGIEFYGEDDLDEAVRYWHKAIELEPGNQEILGYIGRAESEIRNIERLLTPNEKRAVLSTDPPPAQSASKSGSPQPPNPEPPTELPIQRGRAGGRLQAGLAVGLLASQSSSETERGMGWHFAGHLTVRRVASRLSLRLGAGHLEFTGRRESGSPDVAKPHFTIAGVNLAGLVPVWHRSEDELFLSGGIGVYSAGRSTYDAQVNTNAFHRVTTMGYLLGAGWNRSIGSLELSAELRYLNVGWSRFPSMWLLTIGVRPN
ncbi:MAG TPA: hypothetical protein VM118_05475 [Acidobacteriota bacterium]|nr:hypothetical protein [Acidobacteriota bacterium]